MSATRILRTLDFGLMMSIAYPMQRNEREAVARFLGTGSDEAPPPRAFCKAESRNPLRLRPRKLERDGVLGTPTQDSRTDERVGAQ